MPRPSRSWTRSTFTISPEVDKAIRHRAVELGIDPGTVVDAIVWGALVKPNDEELRSTKCEGDLLERLFAEDVLCYLDTDKAIGEIAPDISYGFNSEIAFKETKKLVLRWRKTRRIDQKYKEHILSYFGDKNIVPQILRLGLVEAEWFEP